MRISVRGYLTFRDLVGAREVSLDVGGTVRALLEALVPSGGEEFGRRVFHAEEGLRPGVTVLVNGRPVAHDPEGLTQQLHDGDEVAIFPPLAGGSSPRVARAPCRASRLVRGEEPPAVQSRSHAPSRRKAREMPADFKTELTEVLSHYNLGRLVRGKKDLRGTVNTSYAVETLKNGQRRKLFVRRYRRGVEREEILFEHSILSHVARDPGCPVAPAHTTREGRTFLHVVRRGGDPQGAYYAVFDFLPGEDRYTWVGPRCTGAELRNAGALLARFHRAASTLTPEGHRAEPKILDLLRVIDSLWASSASRSKGSVFDRYLEQNFGLVRQCIARTMAVLSEPAARLLPEVIIHCDYHPGNLKFEGDEITGLVDFDWSKLDLRAFDVALAVWYFCVSWERAADGHLRLGEASDFLRAYQTQLLADPALHPLSPEEIRYLPHLIDAANIYVLYWTLRDYFGKEVDPEKYLIYLRHGVRFAQRITDRARRARLTSILSSLPQVRGEVPDRS